MKPFTALWPGAAGWLLAIGLSGCGAPAPYAGPLSSTGGDEASADCPDISGTYRASSDGQLLPFHLFGILDTASPEWTALVQLTSELRAQPDEAIVTIRFPDPDRLEVIVAVHGAPRARQVLTRSRRSTTAADWWGQGERSFRCAQDGVAIAGTQIFDWDEYLLPDAAKRRYRRPGTNDVGTARGIYRFSRAADGSLVMHQHIYFCLGACELGADGRWEPVRSRWPGADAG